MAYRRKPRKKNYSKKRSITCSDDARSWLESLKADLKKETEEAAGLSELLHDLRSYLSEKDKNIKPYIRYGEPYFGMKFLGLFQTESTKHKSEEYEIILDSYFDKCRSRIERYKNDHPKRLSNLNGIITEYDKGIDHKHVEWCYSYHIKRKDELREKIEMAHKILQREQEKESRSERKKAKQNQQKAILASAMGKSRNLAASLKANLPTEHLCPYCGGELGDNFHADHIYPVSKGGQSREENMVNVCSSCNLRKSDLTLTHFIMKYALDREPIESRLKALGKEY